MACGPHFKIQSLTWILYKDSREGSSQIHAGPNFSVFFPFHNSNCRFFFNIKSAKRPILKWYK